MPADSLTNLTYIKTLRLIEVVRLRLNIDKIPRKRTLFLVLFCLLTVIRVIPLSVTLPAKGRRRCTAFLRADGGNTSYCNICDIRY